MIFGDVATEELMIAAVTFEASFCVSTVGAAVIRVKSPAMPALRYSWVDLRFLGFWMQLYTSYTCVFACYEFFCFGCGLKFYLERPLGVHDVHAPDFPICRG